MASDSTHPLVCVIEAYLVYRRALGRGAEQEEWLLRRLCRFLSARDASELDAHHFDDWRESIGHLHPNSRFTYENIVYHFCDHRRRTQPECFVPDPSTFARPLPHACPQPIAPHQIARLLTLTATLSPEPGSPLRAAVMRLALVLLYTSGLRLGELLRLVLGDIDVDAEGLVLHIRESKFHKSRWVPLSPSAGEELRAYLRIRHAQCPDERASAPLLCNRCRGWRPYSHSGMYQALHALFRAGGVHDSAGRCPRVHDIRHAFAREALVRWYRQGGDVQTHLPKLALYMGHVSIASTAYYLRFMPDVVTQASARFERVFGALVAESAP